MLRGTVSLELFDRIFLNVRQVFLLKSYAEQRRRADRVQFRFRPMFHLFSLSRCMSLSADILIHFCCCLWHDDFRFSLCSFSVLIFGALVPRPPSMCVKFSRNFHQSTPQPPPNFHANLLTWIFWKIYGEFDAPKGECKSFTSGSPRSIRLMCGGDQKACRRRHLRRRTSFEPSQK